MPPRAQPVVKAASVAVSGPIKALLTCLSAVMATLFLCLASTLAWAADLAWDSLGDDQRQALHAHREAWDSYPPRRQLHLLRQAQTSVSSTQRGLAAPDPISGDRTSGDPASGDLGNGRNLNWEDLGKAEREVLRQHARDWNRYPPKKRLFLLREAHQHGRAASNRADATPATKLPWQQLRPEEKKLLRRHREQWNNYSPEQQARIRGGVQRFLQLPPDKRERLRRKFQQFQQLPPEKRRLMRERFRDQMMPPRETK